MLISLTRRAVFGGLAAVLIAGFGASQSLAGEINSTTFGSVAIDGTDPVAYFQEGRPVEGSSDFEHEWKGATWQFASAENRDLFAADPEAYAPQYGGYCAWAVSQGYTASIDPEAWKIVDGKLYLNYSKGVQSRWAQDIPGHITAADQNWPEIAKGL